MHASSEALCNALLKALPAGLGRVALAVSGGCDSVSLLRLFHQLKARGDKCPECVVLTVDHGLRDGSAEDAAFVSHLAGECGMQAHILHWQGEKPESGVQEAARDARYALMIEKCRSLHLDALITAHTLDDQAETFFMRLRRGSGLDGLASMSPVSTHDEFLLLRPLLNVRRAELQNFLTELQQNWCEDPSNQNTDFERVQVRQIMPALEGLGLSAENMAQSVSRLWRVRRAIEAQLDEIMPQAVNWFEAGFAQIDHSVFRAVEDEIALRILSQVLQGVGGCTRAPQLQKLERAFHTWQRAQTGSGLTLAGCRLVVKKKSTYVVRESRRKSAHPPTAQMMMRSGERRLFDRRFLCELSKEGEAGLDVRLLGRKGWEYIKHENVPLADMPSYLGHGLVSLWQGDELLSVPHIGFFRKGVRFDARFMPNGLRVVPELRGFS